jgi:hypothetical protein
MTTKIISYSLFGNLDRYTKGMIKNAELALQYMPDWILHVWHDNTVPDEILEELDNFSNVTLKFFDETYPTTAARFLSADLGDYVVFKDADDRISARWITTVNEWIASGIANHIIKDHPQGHSAEILAGMWGTSNKFIKDMNKLLRIYFDNEFRIITRNSDQDFLRDIIYPIIQKDVLYHSENYVLKLIGNSKAMSFSTPDRFPSNYIGVALLDNDYFANELDTAANRYQPYQYDFDLLD